MFAIGETSKAHFRWGPKVQIHRNQFWSKIESLSWILPLTIACILVLQIMSSLQSSAFWSQPIDFPFKTGAM